MNRARSGRNGSIGVRTSRHKNHGLAQPFGFDMARTSDLVSTLQTARLGWRSYRARGSRWGWTLRARMIRRHVIDSIHGYSGLWKCKRSEEVSAVLGDAGQASRCPRIPPQPQPNTLAFRSPRISEMPTLVFWQKLKGSNMYKICCHQIMQFCSGE